MSELCKIVHNFFFYELFIIYFSAIQGQLVSYCKGSQAMFPEMPVCVYYDAFLNSEYIGVGVLMLIEEQQEFLLCEFNLILVYVR